MKSFILALSLVFSISINCVEASDLLPIGSIKNLSYRGNYIKFRVVGADGTNYCSPCPADPGGMNTQQCWIPETSKAEVAMVLLASAQGKKVTGRIPGFTFDCNVYQLSIQD